MTPAADYGRSDFKSHPEIQSVNVEDFRATEAAVLLLVQEAKLRNLLR